jgi:hypothetical protein
MRWSERYGQNIALGMENNPLRIAGQNKDNSSTNRRGNVHTPRQHAARSVMLVVWSLIVGVIRPACARQAQ